MSVFGSSKVISYGVSRNESTDYHDLFIEICIMDFLTVVHVHFNEAEF